MRMLVAATATGPGILDSSCLRHRCTLVLCALCGNMDRLGMTLSAGSDGQSFGQVIMLTFLLMFVIMAIGADDRVLGQAAAIAIGEVILLDARFGGPIRSASMNPGPVAGRALTSASRVHLWVYIAGLIIGAVLGALVYELVRGERLRPGVSAGADT